MLFRSKRARRNPNDKYTGLSLSISAELDELLEKEEIMWRDRSRVSWLKAGDRNTRYFHQRATWRQKKNKIEQLQLENGTVLTNQKDLEFQIFLVC